MYPTVTLNPLNPYLLCMDPGGGGGGRGRGEWAGGGGGGGGGGGRGGGGGDQTPNYKKLCFKNDLKIAGTFRFKFKYSYFFIFVTRGHL